jgi:hypothetical protein
LPFKETAKDIWDLIARGGVCRLRCLSVPAYRTHVGLQS